MAGPGFVANSPSIEEPDIANSAFWPHVSLTDCRAVMRIGSEITPERLREALINGIIDTNADLAAWRFTQEQAGHADLAAVPAEEIDGDSINLTLYRRAVYNFAKAELTERYRDYDSTLQGGDRADNLDPTIDQYRRQAILAIRQISGRQRTTVDLI
ncbi:head completion/stabilization protein [Marinobacterium iners]|uniref:Phage head completion protein (GPL) n=1 Tax=Marinobacterium iners DSM 11526 TaxID=1122198 RepID=A0A1H3ZVB3_9GAMM|nr:head completion/stabilization protein [Marinobacterium iners]SEA27663.1 Phage head completion protein (GPL) [Marinobacterium iners DSM 11526]